MPDPTPSPEPAPKPVPRAGPPPTPPDGLPPAPASAAPKKPAEPRPVLNRPYLDYRPPPPVRWPVRGLAILGIAVLLAALLATLFRDRLYMEYLLWWLGSETVAEEGGAEKPLTPVQQKLAACGAAAVPGLVRTLDTMDMDNPYARNSGNDRAALAMDLLLRKRPPEALPLLVERLFSRNPSTRYWAAVMVGRLGDERNLLDVKAAYDREKHPDLQRELALLRLRWGDRDVVPLLIAAMADESPEMGAWDLGHGTWGQAFYRELAAVAGIPPTLQPGNVPFLKLSRGQRPLYIHQVRAWWDENEAKLSWDPVKRGFVGQVK